MATYRIILIKISDATRKNWGVLLACVLSYRGIAFSVTLVIIWNVSYMFSKIFQFTIHVA